MSAGTITLSAGGRALIVWHDQLVCSRPTTKLKWTNSGPSVEESGEQIEKSPTCATAAARRIQTFAGLTSGEQSRSRYCFESTRSDPTRPDGRTAASCVARQGRARAMDATCCGRERNELRLPCDFARRKFAANRTGQWPSPMQMSRTRSMFSHERRGTNQFCARRGFSRKTPTRGQSVARTCSPASCKHGR